MPDSKTAQKIVKGLAAAQAFHLKEFLFYVYARPQHLT